MSRGILAALVAYSLWGVLPIFWRALQAVPPLEILCHRTVWSLLFVLLLLALRRQWGWLRQVRRRPRILVTFLASTCLLGVNWFTYIWAVNAGHVVDTSLGYFINPLITVLLGVVFLRERLRLWQGVAITLAAAGVLYLTLGHGAFPWIALVLAGTFGIYGLLRKTASLGSLEGLGLETALLAMPALAYLLSLQAGGAASFGRADPSTSLLLALSGVVTALPLLMFGYAARHVNLSTIGVLHYIAPTLQFLLGLFLYGEPFSQERLIGFAAIWLALLIYSLEGFLAERKHRAQALPAG